MPDEIKMTGDAGTGEPQHTAGAAESVAEWTQEATSFARARLAANLHYLNVATRCNQTTDLMKLNREWVERAFSDYSRQAAKIRDLTFRTAQRAYE